VVLRHVLRSPEAEEPIAAELLRSGYVWVYPDAIHRFAEVYGDHQAQAATARAGGWAETKSSAVFRPRGELRGGFPVNPEVIPALRAMDATAFGNTVLRYVNLVPVEIGVAQLNGGTLGTFDSRHYSIQLSVDLMGAAPESIAAVLFHEMVHAKQTIERGVAGRDLDCYGDEKEAFEMAALYWFSLYGSYGKPSPSHWLDQELNGTLYQYRGSELSTRVHEAYGHQCGAA
jgi:hypothetical protein